MEFMKDLWDYLKSRKKFWLLPLIVTMLLISAIIIFSGGTAVAPFIYSIF
jgi:Family of unknown function (DUF5989)